MYEGNHLNRKMLEEKDWRSKGQNILYQTYGDETMQEKGISELCKFVFDF